ncbi:unnamed protein product [Nippostrongylus brasiliensis]|uniref:DDE Tnp4 domain-containing protein n=1 Tax=Nippostrongylus brasiliensis TaxID=27835 RepID=A0A0N4YKD3_NIPBR|nr:unnamed protein product [Nippostrongylus brasiliensis]
MVITLEEREILEFSIGRWTVTPPNVDRKDHHDEAFHPVTEETWRRSAQHFHNALKYPRGVGCVDGKHAPDNSGSTFYNYKYFLPIVLLAVVDSEHRILGYDLGGNERESDSGK